MIHCIMEVTMHDDVQVPGALGSGTTGAAR